MEIHSMRTACEEERGFLSHSRPWKEDLLVLLLLGLAIEAEARS